MLKSNVQMKVALALVAAVMFMSSSAEAAKKKNDPTIFIAPFSTQSTAEYHWISDAMANALGVRLFQTSKVNYIFRRQIMSSIRNDKIDRTELHDPKEAAELGKTLGADFAVVGTFNAAWPEIQIVIRVIDVSNNNVVHTFSVAGYLDDLVKLEGEIAVHLAEFKPLSKMPTKEGRFGTSKLYAWRHETLAQQILMAQSLAPTRASILPQEAIKKAMESAKAALAIDPKYDAAHASVALCHVLLQDLTNAGLAYEEASSSAKTDPEVALIGYFIKWQQRQDALALQELDNIIKNHQGFLRAYIYKGELLQAMNKHEDAVAHFQSFLERAPKQVRAMSGIGLSFSKLKRYNEAISITKQAVDMRPNSPTLLVSLADRYIDAQRYTEAETHLKNTMKSFPEYAPAYVRLSSVYLQVNRLLDAKHFAEEAIRLAGDLPQHNDRGAARINLAQYYLINGEITAAADALQLAHKDGATSIEQLQADSRCADGLKDSRMASSISLFK